MKKNGERIEYKSDMDDFLAKTMIFFERESFEKLLDDCKNTFYRAMDNCYNVLGVDAFRFDSESGNRRPINMPLFEVLMYVFSDNVLMIDVNYTKEKVEDFKKNI